MSVTNTYGKDGFIPESKDGRVVNITWKDDDEFKMFGKHKWKNGETKTIGEQDWWSVRNNAHGFNGSYTLNSSFGSDNSHTFTTESGVTLRVQKNNDYLQVGEKFGLDDDIPPEDEEARYKYCYGT